MNGVTDVALHLDHTELVQLFGVNLVIHLGGQHACVCMCCVCVGRSRRGPRNKWRAQKVKAKEIN